MALSLGVDTGGTYTDAVLIRDERDVIATAKALTTRHDFLGPTFLWISALPRVASQTSWISK